ncbi:hypothetical protein B0H66DRAFT_634456 [Apodospora peruviana]|uniref:Polyketide synthase n=1 Tax=Apodospora peruviana TaxID=516989 RepID=A0AAE0IQ08_9PEZI|nr:hypothetical protein B0H66DRAFT_634456 [Apodospora peruviana]
MEPYAIVGVSFRMPQDALDESSLWEVLENRRNLVTDWPEDRVSVDSFHDGGSKKLNTLHGRGAHFLKQDPSVFDAPFFSITAKEAACMDPQQRWALETTYHAFESAGIPVESIRGSRTAVFGGSMTNDYATMLSRDADTVPRQAIMGTATCLLANRVSWYFHLTGPSVQVDTACSSSMVALDMACQSMRSGDATAAVVVGTSALLTPDSALFLGNMNFLSPDSKCFSFDERANGYSRGEGVVVLVLKPLADAVRDGHVIRAVVRATASNQDGRTPILTAPSASAQEALVRHVYAKAGLSFDETRYCEAHGTGTPTGDPTEMAAIGRVFRPHRSGEDPLFVGSIKPNVGHLEGAAGLAGVVKSILILEKGIIPPNALFEKLNPNIDAKFHNIEVPAQRTPWPTSGLRRVSVNSFGFGGSNAHVILDDAGHYLQDNGLVGGHHNCDMSPSPSLATTNVDHANGHGMNGDENGNAVNGHTVNGNTTNGINAHTNRNIQSLKKAKLLVWSAADSAAVQRMLAAYRDYYDANIAKDDNKLDRLAYTLAARRSTMPWRTFAVMDAQQGSGLPTPSTMKPVRASTSKTATAFVFTGQGAQYAGMGMELLQYFVFEESLRKSDEIFKSLGCGLSMVGEIRSGHNLNSPEFCQPWCTALQIALIELLSSFGVAPAAVVGHSSGEIAAAYAIGALSHESACKVAYYRGQVAGKLSSENRGGAMMSVNLAESEISACLDDLGKILDTDVGGSVNIACVNSPTNVTLSGPDEIIDSLKRHLDQQGTFAHKLNTGGVAYHSPAMREVAAEYLELMGNLETDLARMKDISMVSSVTGKIVTPKVLATAQYWVDNLVSPVRFSDALQRLTSTTSGQAIPLPLGINAITDLVEIGPHAALRRPVRDIVSASLRYHAVLERTKSPVQTTLEFLGTLFCHGYPVSILTANQQTAQDRISYLIDCPPYPFDHGRRYWSESRISKDFRLRAHTPGYLLGRRAHDWNELQPRWRNWLSVEAMPWLADHVISGATVCPGSGMLVMAIEAARCQMAKAGRKISGFRVTDARFLTPIRVGESLQEATETELHLRPVLQASDTMRAVSRSEISIFSRTHDSDRFVESFRTMVQIEYEDETAANPVTVALDNDFHQIRQQVEGSGSSCAQKVDSSAFYAFCEEHGTQYGDSFRLLDGIAWDGNHISVGRIDMASAKRHYDTQDESPVHPAVLDATLQLILTQLSQGLSDADTPTVVPRRLANMWISTNVWDKASLQLSSTLHSNDTRTMNGDVSIYALSDDGSPLCAIEHLILAGVSRGGPKTPKQGDMDIRPERPLLYNIAWKPQLSSLGGNELQRFCDDAAVLVEGGLDEAEAMTLYPKMDLSMRMAARKALETLTPADLERAPAHMHKYVAAMKHRLQLPPPAGKPEFTDQELEAFLQECDIEECDWKIFPAVARSLPSILRGETDPLELMFNSHAAEAFYSRIAGDHMRDGRLRAFLELAAHENPNQKILEVGAGTGGLTRHILDALRALEAETCRASFGSFTYTDISPVFFETAREKFFSGKWCQDREIVFKMLNVEQQVPDEEGGQYDMIIAGNVIHATADMVATLRNVRRLLKPGGQFVLWEITSPESESLNTAFGSIEGWWNGIEPWREFGPLADEQRWDGLLRENGFSGNTLLLRDFESDVCHLSSIIVSMAVDDDVPEEKQLVLNGGASHDNGVTTNGATLHESDEEDSHALVVLVDLDSEHSQHATNLLEQMIEEYPTLKTAQLADINEHWTAPKDAVVVSLLEFGAPNLTNMSEEGFNRLRHIIQGIINMLWVTSPWTFNNDTDTVAHDDAHLAVAKGFLRSMRSEFETDKHIVTLSIESMPPSSVGRDGVAGMIMNVAKKCFWNNPASPEVEFVVRNGQLIIGRLMRELELDAGRVARIAPQTKMEPWQSGPHLVLEVGTPGMLDTLQFVEDSSPPDLAPDEVEIVAAAWPLSFRDVFVALGKLGGNEPLGFECAGTVSRRGNAVSSDIHVGDRVVMVQPGCMGSHPRAPDHCVFKIPDHLSFNEAISAINPCATAYHALVNVARLQPSDKILIHAATGSTGQMAVRIAKFLVGAEVYATVGSAAKKELLVRELGIPEDHIFYSRNASFAKDVMRATNGKGVDVVLNSLSGDGLRASWECVAPYGRFLEIGKVDIQANSALPMASFAKNVTFAAIDLLHIVQTDNQMIRRLIDKVLELTANGISNNNGRAAGIPTPLHTYPVSDIEKAFRYMQSGENTGRTIVTMSPEDQVTKFVLHKSTWTFSPNASYLVAGGLGGLGRTMIRWMADKGAKYLIVPSPTGMSSPAAAEAVAELTSRGVRVVATACDVSSQTELSALLADCLASGMPPIKGCINAAMTLQDSIFDNMTHAQWQRTIRSKVDTSWNLHQALPPSTTDFFILLSSIAGIYGTVAQCNYAAGCTFQDHLARLRSTVPDSKTSVSLNLGWMRTIGIIAEREQYRRYRHDAGDMAPVEAEDLIALLDHYCDPTLSSVDTAHSQLLVGAITPAHFRARGEKVSSGAMSRPLFSGFDSTVLLTGIQTASDAAGQGVTVTLDPAVQFQQAGEDKEARCAVVVGAVKTKLARALGVAAEEIDVGKMLSDYGTDSLMAVELRNWIKRDFGADVAVFDIMGAKSIVAVGELVSARAP